MHTRISRIDLKEFNQRYPLSVTCCASGTIHPEEVMISPDDPVAVQQRCFLNYLSAVHETPSTV